MPPVCFNYIFYGGLGNGCTGPDVKSRITFDNSIIIIVVDCK